MTWMERHALGIWLFENDNGDMLKIIHHNEFDVYINNNLLASRKTYREAQEYADKYMQSNP